MAFWSRSFLVLVLAGCFLLADQALGVPTTFQATFEAGSSEAVEVARRRRRRRKKRRTRPKPKPAPDTPAPAPAPEPAAAPASGGSSLSRTTRIEFDAQLIKGQTTKAGEVQILERKDTELKSMVKRRTSFRDEIIHTVFPDK